ncbi:MAG: SH3 domain-containing protein [Anaerostipes sp.]|nr:SH3 domain-containing protein [Anaerostipes sp.]
MRKLTKGIVATLFFSLALSLSGCGNSKDKTEATTKATTEATTQATTQATTEASTDAKTGHQLLTCEIQQIKKDRVLVKDATGNTYWFVTKNVDLELKNGMHAGNIIAITYEGDILKDGSINCKVVKLVDNDENAKKEVKKVVKKAKKVKITKRDDTMYAKLPLNVRTNPNIKGKKIGYLKTGQSVNRTGECDNGWARITYKGKTAYVFAADLSSNKVKVTTAKMKPTTTAKKHKTTTTAKKRKTTTERKKPTTTERKQPTTTETKQPTEQKTIKIEATVVEGSMNNLLINYKGVEYTIYTGHAKITSVNGILNGNTITIEYQGDLGKDPKVLTVDDKDANQ